MASIPVVVVAVDVSRAGRRIGPVGLVVTVPLVFVRSSFTVGIGTVYFGLVQFVLHPPPCEPLPVPLPAAGPLPVPCLS